MSKKANGAVSPGKTNRELYGMLNEVKRITLK